MSLGNKGGLQSLVLYVHIYSNDPSFRKCKYWRVIISSMNLLRMEVPHHDHFECDSAENQYVFVKLFMVSGTLESSVFKD